MDIWEEGVGAGKPSCSGPVSGPRLGILGVGWRWWGTGVQVGDLGGIAERGSTGLRYWDRYRWWVGEGGLGCGWWEIGVRGGIGERGAWVAGGRSPGDFDAGGWEGGPGRHLGCGHMGRSGLWVVVAVVIWGDTHLMAAALVTQTSLVFGAEL